MDTNGREDEKLNPTVSPLFAFIRVDSRVCFCLGFDFAGATVSKRPAEKPVLGDVVAAKGRR
jgi:hypothetical protein